MKAAKQAALQEFRAARAECRTLGGGGKGGGTLGCCLSAQGCAAIGVSSRECAAGDPEGNFPSGTFVAFGGSAPHPGDPGVQLCCIAPAGDKGNCYPCP